MLGAVCFLSPSRITYVAPELPPPIEQKAELTIEQKIALKAKEVGFDPAKALAIARAESRFQPNAKNPRSTASGVYQFLDGTFRHYCIDEYEVADSMAQKNDPDIQIECALQMLKDGGIHHWDASKPVWSKFVGA